MIHRATPDFWVRYRALPPDVQILADKVFSLLKQIRAIRLSTSNGWTVSGQRA